MKKVVVFCLALAMAVSMSLTVFAGPGIFVSSPSGNSAPMLAEYTPKTDGCTAKLVVTSYADRATLDDATRLQLEKAYEQISGSADEFTKALEQLAKDKNMEVSQLSASDLFDISYYDCGEHEDHEGFTITLKAETLDRFVGFMHMNGDAWEIINVSEYNEEEETITFYVAKLSPFAIIVDNGSGDSTTQTEDNTAQTDNKPGQTDNDSAQTGDGSVVYVGAMAVAAFAIVLAVVSMKKQKA